MLTSSTLFWRVGLCKSGGVTKREQYVIEGTAKDGATMVGIVGRFLGSDRFLIITVYKVASNLRSLDYV